MKTRIINQKTNQLIFIALLAVLSTAKTFAHGGPADAFRGQIHASGTHFATPMLDFEWNNYSSDTTTKANYANFDGETFVTLVSYDKQTEITLESKAKVSKGRLCIVVENSSNEILYEKTFRKDETVSTTLTLDVYEQYKIRFIGEKTKGAYACEWIQKQ